MTILAPLPKLAFRDNNGNPAVNGLLFTYVSNTTTKLTTYKDSTTANPNTNPIQLDYRGECDCWLTQNLAYTFTLSPAGDTDPPTKPIWTVNNINPSAVLASANYAPDTGTANAYAVLTAISVPAYVDGLRVSVKIANTNTGASTLNYNTLGIKNITLQNGAALVGGELIAGGAYDFEYINPSWQLLGPSITQSTAVYYARTAAEIASGVTPVNAWYPPYDLRRYGGTGDNVFVNNTAFANWKLACDQAIEEGIIPSGNFKITADIELPIKVRCLGGVITGVFNTLYQKRQYGWVEGLQCQKFFLRGCYSCNVNRLQAFTSVVIDGFNGTFGTFWCNFEQWTTPSLTIDITNWAVNSNQWYGGLIRYLHITGSNAILSATEANSNVWDGVDFSNNALANFGVLQDDTVGHPNVLRNCYLEAGSNVRGNFHIFGHTMDSTVCLATHRLTHALGAMSTTERDARDFLSLQVHNNARGGNWDWLDFNGKPPCLVAGAGTSAVSVVVDATEPNGIGQAYQATLNGAFAQFQITIKASGLDRMCCVFYYNCLTDFISITVNDGSTNTAVDPSTWTTGGMANGWKLMRVEAHANPTGDTVITLSAQGAVPSGSPVFKIGGIFAGQERAVLYPQKNDEYFSANKTTGGITNTMWHAVGQFLEAQDAIVQTAVATNPLDIAFVYPIAFGAAPLPTYGIQDDGSGNAANVTSMYVTTRTAAGFTLRINHTGNFSGTVWYKSSGNRI